MNPAMTNVLYRVAIMQPSEDGIHTSHFAEKGSFFTQLDIDFHEISSEMERIEQTDDGMIVPSISN